MSNKRKCDTSKFQTVKRFIETLNYKVRCEEDIEDSFFPYQKLILIKKRLNKEAQLFYLLHELGHAMIHINCLKWKYENIQYTIDHHVTSDLEKTELWQASVLAEEHEAWKIGKSISYQLGLEINFDKYHKLWSESICEYIHDAHAKLNVKK
jgi:hypothetical protein